MHLSSIIIMEKALGGLRFLKQLGGKSSSSCHSVSSYTQMFIFVQHSSSVQDCTYPGYLFFFFLIVHIQDTFFLFLPALQREIFHNAGSALHMSHVQYMCTGPTYHYKQLSIVTQVPIHKMYYILGFVADSFPLQTLIYIWTPVIATALWH